ncbi:Hypothetical_protein [Hexamita inflata]|uniref:Hypothetical_protein n=1 Tax=Hexamita inflata TaxID=28002 RepID=A0AA86QY74_9EUKA|nr:Hypothetical protein HINF_LOCUS55911 [Hexamita inflata]
MSSNDNAVYNLESSVDIFRAVKQSLQQSNENIKMENIDVAETLSSEYEEEENEEEFEYELDESIKEVINDPGENAEEYEEDEEMEESEYEEEIVNQSEVQECPPLNVLERSLSYQHIMPEQTVIAEAQNNQSAFELDNTINLPSHLYKELVKNKLVSFTIQTLISCYHQINFQLFASMNLMNFRNPLTAFVASIIDQLSIEVSKGFSLNKQYAIGDSLNMFSFGINFIIFVLLFVINTTLQKSLYALSTLVFEIHSIFVNLETVKYSLSSYKSYLPFILSSGGHQLFRFLIQRIFNVYSSYQYVDVLQAFVFAFVHFVLSKLDLFWTELTLIAYEIAQMAFRHFNMDVYSEIARHLISKIDSEF